MQGGCYFGYTLKAPHSQLFVNPRSCTAPQQSLLRGAQKRTTRFCLYRAVIINRTTETFAGQEERIRTTGPENPHDLLDNQILRYEPNLFNPFGCDRLILSANSILTWNSLMPSQVWDFCKLPELDNEKPTSMQLDTRNITSGIPHAWLRGIIPAGVGRMQAHVTVSTDLKAMACTWPRYSDTAKCPIAVKSYAWKLEARPTHDRPVPLKWTHFVDSSRVDLTFSTTFVNSRAAVAFSADGASLWTSGGAYDLETGTIKVHAPALFRDQAMSALTFSHDASTIAGIRGGKRLEMYDILGCECKASVEGDIELLSVSPLGNFCLYLWTPLSGGALGQQELRLLSKATNNYVTLRSQIQLIEQEEERVHVNLSHFYRSGGLYAFSKGEQLLVLSLPDWNIRAYDLRADKVVTTWLSDNRSTYPISLVFSPLEERLLYIWAEDKHLHCEPIEDEEGSHHNKLGEDNPRDHKQQREQPVFTVSSLLGSFQGLLRVATEKVRLMHLA